MIANLQAKAAALVIAVGAAALLLGASPAVAQGGQGVYWQCKTGSSPGWCPVSSDNPLPTAGGGGGGDVNISSVGGNTVSTSVPVSGSVTASAAKGSTFSPTQVTLSTAAVLVLNAAGAGIVSRQVCNADSAIVEYIGATGVTSATGMPLQPLACFDVSRTTAAIYAVAASGTPQIAVVQY